MDAREAVAEQQRQAAIKPTKAKEQPVLMPDRFGEAEFKRHDFVADIPAELTLEAVLEPAYWSHVAAGMDPFDHIECRWEDGSRIAYLVVLFCERTYAKVKLDRQIEIEKVGEGPVSLKHKVEWKGPHHKFVVVRTSDSMMIQSGFKTRSDAEAWTRNHEKGMEK